MRLSILTLGVAVLFFISYSFTDKKEISLDEKGGISFETSDWSNITSKAKKEKKIIFLDVFAAWCGPCKMLKKKTFVDEKVGSYFNTHFVNAAFDAEKGEGIDLAKKYQVYSYPTLLFLNSDGSILKKVVGYHSPEEIIELGQEIVKSK